MVSGEKVSGEGDREVGGVRRVRDTGRLRIGGDGGCLIDGGGGGGCTTVDVKLVEIEIVGVFADENVDVAIVVVVVVVVRGGEGRAGDGEACGEEEEEPDDEDDPEGGEEESRRRDCRNN